MQTAIRSLTPSEFSKVQYFRPPAWRAARAKSLMQRTVPRIPRDQEDPAVLEYLKYLRFEQRLKERHLPDQEMSRKLASRWPQFYSAHEFASQTLHNLPRASLEARILAGLSDRDIAERIGRPEFCVTVYREMFFDVADRLENVDYIAGFVIAPVFQAGIETLNVELMARYFGYFGGPEVVEQVLYGLTRNPTLAGDDEISGWMEKSVSRTMKYQMATLMLLLQPSRFDVRNLVEGYMNLLRLEREFQQGNQENAWVSGVIELMRQTNRVPRNEQATLQYREAVRAPDANLVLEPRAAHRLLLADGELSKEQMEKQLQAFQLPEQSGMQIAKFSDSGPRA